MVTLLIVLAGLATRAQAAPGISSLSPTSGTIGTAVVVTGSNFGSTQGSSTVTFNGTAATPTSWSNTSIAVPVPSGATTGNVVVTVGGLASNGMSFTVVPSITSLQPNTGAIGSIVAIEGEGFGVTQGASTVTVSGKTPTINSWADERVIIVIPSSTTTGNAIVTVGGRASNAVTFTVTPTPNITSVSPAVGIAGTAVTITGSNLGAAQGSLGDVIFDGIACRCSPVWSNTIIHASVPPGARTGTVMVRAAGGVGSNALPFSVPPAITNVTPAAGTVGSSVTVTGTEFGATQGTSTVTFDGIAVTPTSWSDTSFVFAVPSGADTGNVVVTVAGLASSGAMFAVIPTITSVTPTSGAAGASVTISGNAFGPDQATSTVTFNGTAATPTSWSNTSIVVPVPNGATTGNVVVTVGGNASNGASFTATLGIGSESPTSGAVGTSVTISGTGFGSTQGTSTVKFNGTAATPTSWSSGSIVTPVPSGATTGNLVVTVGGIASNGASFTVTPGISSMSPTSGAAGASVTISGTNFGSTQGSSTVTFNGAAATPTSWSNASIVAPVPNGATTGNVVVTVGGNASNGASFTTGLGIGSESPSAGPVGTLVTISGTGFGSTQGTSTVTFNGTAATPTSWSNGSIVAQVPNGASSGNLVVTVGGIASNAKTFTVTPGINSMLPTSGAAGVSVTISGTNFGSTQGSSTVTFNGAVATPTNWSNTSIVVPVPNGATTGNVVVTVGGNASNGASFTTGLGIGSESPTSGAVGTSVTISGTGFGSTQGSSTVTFNGTAATPTSWSNGSIVAQVPSGASTGNLVVTVGGIVSNGVGFTVTPGINSMLPTSGAAGVSVTISGTGFGSTQGSSTVTFNGAAATPTSWSNTSIVVPVPNGATTGNVVVTVGGNASNGASFTTGLGIGSESPSAGPVGTLVTISGTGFGSTQGSSTVTFNGTAATPTSWSNGSIVAQVPSGASTGNLVVTVGGIASNGVGFTITTAPVVQSNSGFGSGVVSTSVPFLSSNTAGNLLWIAVGSGGTITPPTDTLGNTYTLAASVPVPGGVGNAAIYYVASAKAGANTVTCNQSGANDIHCHVAEVTGFASPSPLDQIGSVASSSSCSVSTSGATAQPNEWVGAFFYNSFSDPALSAGTGYNAVQLSNNPGDAALSESETVSSAGVQTATCNGNSSTALTQLITTFQTTASLPGPAISSLSPSSGPVGSAVVIAGSNFGATQGVGTVTFNGVAAKVTTWSASNITAVAPAGVTTGNVVVTVAGVPSAGVLFTVVPPPGISTLTPNSGPRGSAVVIAGSNLGSTQGGSTVTFNGAIASVTSWSNTSVTAVAPSGASSGNVAVTAAGGVSSAGLNFTVVASPSISSLTPNTGAVGSSVTIAGTNFGTIQGNGTLTFNGTPVTLLQWSNTSIVAQVPAGATTGNVVVTAGGGVASAGVTFTVLPAPVITSLSPTSGTVGTQVTITGNNFGSSQGTSTVTINGAVAAARGRLAVSWSNTSIVVTVPSGATSGNVVVTVGGQASNPVVFGVGTFITALSPSFGAVGTLISVNGSGFGTSQGQSTVTFNGGAAAPTNWSNSSIVVPVPSGVTSGNVVVTVGGVASNPVVFTAAPVISSLSASTLAVGAPLTITGLNFGASQGTGTVTFNGIVGQPTSWSSSSIVVSIPIGATPGNVVVTANGMASNGVGFTPGPFISALSLTTAAVGTPITITGGNFGASQGSSTLTFNGLTGTPSSWSNTQIVVPVPMGATPGNVIVTVNGLATNPVNFIPGPSLTGLNLVTDTTGTTVTLTGVNFGSAQGSSSVTFNGVPATSFPQWTNTQIQAVVPSAATTGNVVVTVAGIGSNGVLFTVLPNISSLSPASGITGATININGTGFGNSQGTSTLTFNNVAASPITWSDTQIVAQVPSTATTGNVVVTVGGNASNGVNFVVLTGISSLSPASGPVGTEVTINGSTFGATQGTSTVTFNGTIATPSSWSNSQIVVAVPSAATTGNVVVTVGGNASNPIVFTVTTGQAGAASVLTSFVASDGSAHTFYVGPDQHVYHLFWNSTNNWQFQDVTDITAANPAATGSAVTSFLKSDGSYNVAYLDGNNDVNELVWSGGTWSSQDLTAASGSAVTAASGSRLTSLTDAVGDNIYYLAANQHEYQLNFDGFNWNNQDLTALSGTTILAASGSALTSFALSDATEHSIYIGSNQHVYQMLNVPSTGYFNQDLTDTAALNIAGGACATEGGTCTVSGTKTVGFGAKAAWNFLTVSANVACNVATFGDPAPGVAKACYFVNTSFPVAASGSALTSFNDSNGDHIYYLDGNGHNHELLLKGDPGAVTGPWADLDQTQNSGTTTVAVAGSALTSFLTSDQNQHLVYFPASRHVDQTLYQPSTNVWTNQDLTTLAATSAIAAAGSGLTSFTQSAGNIANIQYLDANGHINQLGLSNTNVWQNQDLTAIATNLGGTSVPGIGNLSPALGPVGAAITINGANFGASQGKSTVSFNGVLATATSWSNTQIVATVPSGATSGNVVVTVGALASNGVFFAVAPGISSLFPPSGPVGTVVTISGSNFGNTQGSSTLSFNGVVATPISWSTTQIVVPVPGAATTGNVVVTVGGVASNLGSFAVAPAITSLSPASALIGTQVTITGTTFGSVQGNSTVTFNGVSATPTSWSNTSIAVPVPAGASSGNVVVTVAGLASNAVAFTVNNPFISSLSPPAGLAGSAFTINGANFGASQGSSTVSFGGAQVTPTSWSASAIGITVPGNATVGSKSVVVTVGGLASNAATFVVTSSPPPSVTSLTPSSGSVGTSVVIAGSNFGSTQGTSTVTFNGVAASVSSWSSSSITTIVPANATSGVVVVTVGGAQSIGQIIFLLLTPTITGIQPGAEAVNAVITINGFGFGNQQGQSTVTFGNTVAPPATSWSATQIKVAVPATLPAGATNVVVTVPGMPASTPKPFTVLPGVTNLTLHLGPAQVGFVITGTNFGNQQPPLSSVNISTANIGLVPLTVNNWSANGITVQVPAGTLAATGSVVITVNNQSAAGSNNAFAVIFPFSCP